MLIDKQLIEQLRQLLDIKPQKIVVVSHSNPDGDAIGSSLAWSRVLRAHGAEVECLVPNRYPGFLECIPGISEIGIFKEDTTGRLAQIIEQADLIFCMDFNQIGRLEALSEAIAANTTAKKVLIDHHLNPPAIYDVAISRVDYSSTSFLVYRIIDQLFGLDAIDKISAESIYVGMMTDTGNFSFGNLTPDLYRAIAHLVECGINIHAINNAIYNNFSEGRIRLLGYSINDKMKIIDRHGVALISLTEAELRRFDFQIGDSEGFVNYPLSIKGIRMSAMFLQTRHFIRISLRSRGDTDVNIFAGRYFEGGGHKNAAGGKSLLSMTETIAKFRQAVDEYFSVESTESAESVEK